MLTALQALRHQSEATDAQQGAGELLGQRASHHHRQSGAGEAPGAGGHGQPLQLGPAAPGQQSINAFDQAVRQTTTVIEDGNARLSGAVLNGNAETIGAAVQSKQQRRVGVSHNGIGTSLRQRDPGAQPTPAPRLSLETLAGTHIPLHAGGTTR